MPANLSFDQAATIPLTMGTAAFGLYGKQTDGLSVSEISDYPLQCITGRLSDATKALPNMDIGRSEYLPRLYHGLE